MDPVARKVALMERQVGVWRKSPPKGRIIAAGSTGSLVPVAGMLAAVADMANGCVILPALDRFMSERDFQNVGQNHPQYGLKNLLARIGIRRSDVADLLEKHAIRPAFREISHDSGLREAKELSEFDRFEKAAKSRELLASMVMLDSTAGTEWRSMPAPDPDVMAGVSRLDLRSEAEEILAVSSVLRDSIERGLKAHLVTPSRKIAKSVASALRRWSLEVDDSAGRPASETETGNYFILALRAVAEDFAPYQLLALLRHSFTHLGYPKAELEEVAGMFEKYVLRGASSGGGLSGLAGRIASLKSERPDRDFSALDDLLERLGSVSRELGSYLSSGKKYLLAALLRSHVAFVENLVQNDKKELDFAAKILYSGDVASQVADEIRGLLAELEAVEGDAVGIDLIDARSYPEFIASRLFGITVRPRRELDRRVAILSSIEARLLDADVVVMAGLNEGTFPSLAAEDPWMSRPMKADFGLPLPERKIGLSSHDFAEFFCRPRVVMTRAAKADGGATTPSRWLQKLDAMLDAGGIRTGDSYADYIMGVVAGLDAPAARIRIGRPAPCPPASARPSELWATAIEKWYRDPYIIYAGKILGLKKLDDIDMDARPADFGVVVHRSIEEFNSRGPRTADGLFSAMLRNAAPFMRIDVIDFWMARFRAIAEWFAAYDAGIGGQNVRTFVEEEGELKVSAGFTLRAKADRIDVMPDGSAIVSDYKTGGAPSRREVDEGFAPQLPLEALILAGGGFAGIGRASPSELRYIELGGRRVSAYGDGLDRLLGLTMRKLKDTVERFSHGSTPYLSRPNPNKVGSVIEEYSEYAHLARIGEWDS
jgi:ATP-dependent helicase/nuclease subunit B